MGTVVERLDDTTLRALVRELMGGREGAWSALVAQLHPHLERLIASSPSLGPLRRSEDHCRNAVTEVLGKLARNEFRALALLEPWLAAHPDRGAGDWVRIVTANVARDYTKRTIGCDATKRLLNSLTSPLPDRDDQLPTGRPPVTAEQTAREILEYAAEHLTAPQLRALEAWIHQVDYAAIGRAAGLDDPAREGERLVRSALARLRRQFAG